METKQCTRCNQILPLETFVKDKNKRDGHASLCKPCNATRLREHRQDNLEQRRAYEREWYKNHAHSERAKEKLERREIKRRNLANPPSIPESKYCPGCKNTKPGELFYRTASNRDGFSTYCKDCASQQQKQWREDNPLLARERDKQSWQKYREQYQANYAKWISENRGRRNEYRNRIHKARMADDPNYRIGMAIRKRILLGLKDIRKLIVCGYVRDGSAHKLSWMESDTVSVVLTRSDSAVRISFDQVSEPCEHSCSTPYYVTGLFRIDHTTVTKVSPVQIDICATEGRSDCCVNIEISHKIKSRPLTDRRTPSEEFSATRSALYRGT